MMRIVSFAAMGLSVLLMFGQAQATGLGIRGYYWVPAVSGDISVDGDSSPGDTLDYTATLGLEDHAIPAYEVYLGVGNQNMSLAYARGRNSGTSTLSEDIYFDDVLYPAQDILSSRLTVTVYDLAYGYNLIATPIIALGVLSRAKYLDGSIELSSVLNPTREKKDFQSTIPMLGVHLRLGLLNFLELAGMASGGYGEGKAFEGQAELIFKPVQLLALHGGYRTQRLEVDDEHVHLNLDDSGPYIALTLGF